MNPQLLIILFLALGPASGKGKLPNLSLKNLPIPKSPAYIDTFKIELALDRLQSMTQAVEKINNLNRIRKIPEPQNKPPSVDRISDSLDAIRGFLSDGKQSHQIDSISNTLSGVKKLGNLDEIMSAMGPMLSMLKNSD
jgi:hypothetical protein